MAPGSETDLQRLALLNRINPAPPGAASLGASVRQALGVATPVAAKFCTQCGTQAEGPALFCGQCGARLPAAVS